jgi:GMP synthase (glutamine-hydrolysing)
MAQSYLPIGHTQAIRRQDRAGLPGPAGSGKIGAMKHALALTHVPFEDLGLIEPLLAARGFRVEVVAAPMVDLTKVDFIRPDLLVILGAPISVNDEDLYPFLRPEIAGVRDRLLAGGVTLGICLGAQMIAKALGAAVYPAPETEIGYAPVRLSAAGSQSPLAPLSGDIPVLHWHGETFDLPDGAVHLTSSALCENQAFAIGTRVLGLQFHLEVALSDLEAWLVGHCVELARAQINPNDLRAQAARANPTLRPAALSAFSNWLHSAGL